MLFHIPIIARICKIYMNIRGREYDNFVTERLFVGLFPHIPALVRMIDHPHPGLPPSRGKGKI